LESKLAKYREYLQVHGLEDPRIEKLESSPYRQKLYFKNRYKNAFNSAKSPYEIAPP